MRTDLLELGLDIEAAAHIESPDSVGEKMQAKIKWTTMLRQKRIDLRDKSVEYPGFLRFVVGAYRWIDKNLNTYDRDYVTGTGRHGKVKLTNDNWLDTYYFHPTGQPEMSMASDIYASIGAQANYSILSLSYSVDMSTLLRRKTSKHKKWGLSITWARILLDAYLWDNSGGTYIRQFDKSNLAHPLHQEFNGLTFKSYGVSGTYFFNYKKFSYGAAYNLSHYQRRSAGSWAVGASGTFYKVDFDFTKLPTDIADQKPYDFDFYNLHYNSVMAYGGYTYNIAVNRHILFNFLLFPGVGISFSFDNSTPGKRQLLALGVKSGMAFSYCVGDYFVGTNAKFDGNLFQTGRLGFMSGIFNFQLSAGKRF